MTTETLMSNNEASNADATGAAAAASSASEQTTNQAATGAGEGGQQQQAEGKDGQGQQQQAAAKTEGDKQQQKSKQPEGAPEKYEDFKAPEGLAFDSNVISQFSEVAKELNLPQDKAQLLLDKMGPVLASRQVEQLQTARTEWVGQVKADKEYGGDALPENLAVAKKALDTFGTPELRTLLNESGLGDHPEVIRVFYRAGKAISEDGFVAGKPNGGANPDPAKRLFPNQA